MRLRHCTAWAAWPFIRLSMAESTITRPVRGSTSTPIKQRLVPQAHLVWGSTPLGSTVTQGEAR